MSSVDKKKIKMFYLNGALHKVIHVNRAKDTATTYDFTEHKFKVYSWSDIKRRKQNAFTITEAGRLIGRHRDRLVEYMERGDIEYPQREYNLESGKPGRYFFSEDDLIKVRDYLATVHIGRPRKDGRITNNRIPSREEFRALIQSGRVLYVKENEDFVPVWKAEEW